MKPFIPSLALAILTLACAARAQTEPAAAERETDQDALKQVEQKAQRMLEGLEITDPAKADRARQTLSGWLMTLRAWHKVHDGELKQLWSDWNAARAVVPKDEFPGEVIAYKIDAVYAPLKEDYTQFLNRLGQELSAEQIDAIKERWSRNPGMMRTYRAYLETVPDLTEDQQKVILDRMKMAREDAMLTDSDREIVSIYKRHKVKVEQYIGSLEWAKFHKAYAARGAAQTKPVATTQPQSTH